MGDFKWITCHWPTRKVKLIKLEDQKETVVSGSSLNIRLETKSRRILPLTQVTKYDLT